MRYQVTQAAKSDIREIAKHICTVQKSPQNAALVASRLKMAFSKIANTPALGHIRSELHNPRQRVYVVSGLLIIFDPTVTPMTILRVVHASRDLNLINT